MIWQLIDGEPQPVAPKLTKGSTFGPMFVYELDGQTYLETNDMLQMGISRENFLKREMPQIRKALGLETDKDKLQNVRVNSARLRDLITSDTEKDPSA